MNKKIIDQLLQTATYKGAIFVLRLFLVLMLAHIFTPSEYGAYSLIMTVYTFGALVCGLNVYSYLYRASPGYEIEKRIEIFKTTFLFEVGFTVLVIILFVISGAMNITLNLVKIYEYQDAFLIGLLVLIACIASNEIGCYHLAKLKIEYTNHIDFMAQSLWVVPLLFFWWLGYSLTVKIVLMANLAGVLLGIIYGFCRLECKAWWRARFNTIILHDALIYSVPLIIPAISVTALRTGDRFILSYYQQLYDVGVYSFAYTFLNTLYTFSAAVILSTMLPYIVQAHNLENIQQRNSLLLNAFKASLFTFLGGALVFIIFSKPIFKLIARSEFLEARGVLPLLLFGYFNVILAYPAHYILLLKKQTMVIMWIDLFGFLIGMVFNFVLIPSYSYYGAAWAMAIAFGSVAIIKIFYTKLWKELNLIALFSLKEEWKMLMEIWRKFSIKFRHSENVSVCTEEKPSLITSNVEESLQTQMNKENSSIKEH